MFEDIDKAIVATTIGFFITIPFAIWKWVEIIIWIVKHVHISMN